MNDCESPRAPAGALFDPSRSAGADLLSNPTRPTDGRHQAKRPEPGDTPPDGVTPLLYQLLVETVVDYAIFVLDPTGHVRTWNPGAERFKGYAAHEIIGQHFSV